jgi:hypothetical protein
MFRSYDHLHAEIFPLEDGHKTETCSVTLDGNPEPDLVHAAGCKQPTLSSSRFSQIFLEHYEIVMKLDYGCRCLPNAFKLTIHHSSRQLKLIIVNAVCDVNQTITSFSCILSQQRYCTVTH